MRVLALGMKASSLTPIILNSGCNVLEYEDKFDKEFLINEKVEFIVSYRYRHIIGREIIDYMKDRIMNLHISLLPWNRGADPNLWSFLGDTPKGVTIHYMDEGLDTGDIIAQKEVFFDPDCETLATTYQNLNEVILELFSQHWPVIMRGDIQKRKQPAGGSFHRVKDKKHFEYLILAKGWDTPVKHLIGKAVPAAVKDI